MSRKSLIVRALLLGGALTLVAPLAGCVERRVLIRSQPVGARLLLDLEEVPGRTPVEVPIEHSGTRHVTLLAPGHRVLEAHADVVDPWFTRFPIDIFTELLWPGTIEDVQTFDFTLRPYPDHLSAEAEAALDTRIEVIRARADTYRAGGSRGPAGGPGDDAADDVPPPPPGPSGSAAPLPPPRIGR